MTIITIHFDYYFHHEWVLFTQETLEMTTTMIVDLAMTGCYGMIAADISWSVISEKTVNLRHFPGRAHACDRNEVALLYNLLVFVFLELLVIPPGPTFQTKSGPYLRKEMFTLNTKQKILLTLHT